MKTFSNGREEGDNYFTRQYIPEDNSELPYPFNLQAEAKQNNAPTKLAP
jgi:hypothetical protein